MHYKSHYNSSIKLNVIKLNILHYIVVIYFKKVIKIGDKRKTGHEEKTSTQEIDGGESLGAETKKDVVSLGGIVQCCFHIK